MNFVQFLGALEIGLVYSFVAMGGYLSFRVLNFADLTVDGSFPLGAAVCATLITMGVNPAIATFAAALAGAMAGFTTAWIATRLNILHLLASILTMTALYSLNLRIMGKPNVSLLGEPTLFNGIFNSVPTVIVLAVLTSVILLVLYYFLKTQVGLAVRATGNNNRMARAQSINDQHCIWLGISVSNALVAFAGALFAQLNGFADVTLGVGTIIIGLAALIIGEALLSARTVMRALIACVGGTIIYRLVITQALNVNGFGLKASDLNLITAVIVTLAMLVPHFKQKIKQGGRP
ncbi:ABC transporter permease [Candidatus Paracaedibacter symbiosus]|uniref:ABC transporter permease n=1 Tax=Candidatus Paracaedibacter symbiosus TaxID=244582 RepID=UPI0005096D65|nr:ABC transporter permease [Candidatus Paracaedibacter symbiosus]